MFSGIVEEAATVVRLDKELDNLHITMSCSFIDELKIDQSLSHNGVCLTVVKKEKGTYTVTAIKETLLKSNLGLLKPGDKVNLERSMRLNDRLDGHIVQGHVDQTAICTGVNEASGSWRQKIIIREIFLLCITGSDTPWEAIILSQLFIPFKKSS